MQGEKYINNVTQLILKAYNQDSVKETINLMVDAIINKQSIYLFGCSHAGIIAEEMFYRTGGLALINPIFFPGFMLNTKPVTLTTKLERIDNIAKALLDENKVKKGDFLLIHSVSGRNTVPIEMAIKAKEMGVNVVCLTNINYSKSVTSRHSSNKNLYEVCDVVIDNMGDFGDTSISIDGLSESIGPTSTAVGVSILNAIVVEVVEKLITKKLVPPIFLSANVDGGDEHNKKIFEEYKENIFYM